MSFEVPALRAVNSINYVTGADRGAIAVAGSHGGLYCGYRALTAGVRGVVLNDAGVGLNGAGIASLALCEAYGMAAATVSHRSARIGDVADMQRRGIISQANAIAQRLGIVAGMACGNATEAMRRAPAVTARPDEIRETRHEDVLMASAAPVVCIDSASLIRAEDAGRIVVTGSHGGLIGGDPAKAMNVACAFAAFNDAGVGIDEAGLGRLAPLDALGIAAVTVGHDSAEIGNARSTLHQGVISHANAAARGFGALPGQRLHTVLVAMLERR
ncbi:MAG: hypothetical protein Q8M24_16885 [Pseudolabrys sp.]|nr:hypothetical protein [Pseudolabrys sp.]MDP2297121.1 hypothetical protein [Pseudolabrys sp.]